MFYGIFVSTSYLAAPKTNYHFSGIFTEIIIILYR
jgi:hypothetical protein